MNIMVDLETMGKGPRAAIVSIGAVMFDPYGKDEIRQPLNTLDILPEHFFATVSLESSVAAGLEMDASTVIWWMGQDIDARSVLIGSSNGLAEVLRAFTAWGRFDHETKVWAHGATFDPVILASAFAAIEMDVPWNFHNVRDTRTIFDVAEKLSGKPTWWPPGGIRHHALWDAWRQAMAVRCAVRCVLQSTC